MSLGEVKTLKGRASAFLDQAERALADGRYDVSVFLADIAAQLYVKAMLLEVVGDYPRTHSLRMLLGELLRHRPSDELGEFLRLNRVRLTALEDAYLTARYTIRSFEVEDAEDAVKLVKEIFELLGR